MRDRHGALLVQAQQHLRPFVAEIVHQTVVQPAVTRAGIERDVGDIRGTQRIGDDIAAEARGIDARRNRAIERGQIPAVAGLCVCAFILLVRHYAALPFAARRAVSRHPTGLRGLTQSVE
jgi:hypothetical protein